MILFALIGSAVLVGGFLVAYSVKAAPDGYEDHEGFHQTGPSPQEENAKQQVLGSTAAT